MNSLKDRIISEVNNARTHKLTKTLFFNAAIIIFQISYLALRYQYLKDKIPFYYTMPWGEDQLAQRNMIWLIPITAAFITIVGAIFSLYAKKALLRMGPDAIHTVISVSNLIMTGALLRIIKISAEPYPPLINPNLSQLMLPAAVAFVIVYFITPRFIEFAKEKDIVTNPNLHHHPGMILIKPSARGGGMVFAIGFVAVALAFVQISQPLAGLLLAVAIGAVVGLLDDIQNTNPGSKLKPLENPLIRLVLQSIAILPILIAGQQITFVGNPFDGIILLDKFTLTIAGSTFAPLPLLITFIWILWVMNMLSWSNGVDGQYSGVVGIALIVIGVLSLRLLPENPEQQNYAKLAMIAAGASFGLLPYSWHPSKIMWGFGAITAGLIISALSIISGTKIAASMIVLLIPFMDALIAVIRRIIQRRNPLRGDRGHLHHLLMERGWSVKRIAVFYWITALLTGFVALVAKDRSLALAIMTLGGIAAFFIILLNLKSEVVRKLPQQAEK